MYLSLPLLAIIRLINININMVSILYTIIFGRCPNVYFQTSLIARSFLQFCRYFIQISTVYLFDIRVIVSRILIWLLYGPSFNYSEIYQWPDCHHSYGYHHHPWLTQQSDGNQCIYYTNWYNRYYHSSHESQILTNTVILFIYLMKMYITHHDSCIPDMKDIAVALSLSTWSWGTVPDIQLPQICKSPCLFDKYDPDVDQNKVGKFPLLIDHQ